METFWLMVVWADNPIGEALVEHDYPFRRLRALEGLLVRCGLFICLVLILLLNSCKLFSTSAVAICQLNCCCIKAAVMMLVQGFDHFRSSLY
jgi:hypothetical protein